MINVIASIRLRPGKVEDYLKILKVNVPKVLNEKGCVGYLPAVDVDAGLPVQQKDENVVTIIEKWDSLQALHDHLSAPHMLEYRKQVKDLVESLSIKVLKEA